MPTPSKPRIYIAGPMTGLPEYNYPEFNRVAAIFRERGYHVENPAENDKPTDVTPWDDYLRDAITRMLTCEVVVVLPGSEKSRGAQLELYIAKRLGMRRYGLRSAETLTRYGIPI